MDPASEQGAVPQAQLTAPAAPSPSHERESAPPLLEALDLGVVPYAEALEYQRSRREKRLASQAADALLLLEHPPVFTRGRRSDPAEFVSPPDVLRAQGFGVFDIERGGKTTYHGPGQLVGYPVVSLMDLGLAATDFVGKLEQCMIGFLAAIGLEAHRRKGFPGVWVNDRKIAAIGVHLKRWVSIHGFALNLAPNLSHFDLIVPCGLPDIRVTSVLAEMGRSPTMAEAKLAVAEQFRRVFGYPSLAWIPSGNTSKG